MSEKMQLLIMRILIAVFIAISVVIAILQYKSNVTFIAQLMGVSWGALAGAFLAPFLYGLYWKRTSKASVWVCFIFSTVVMLANIFFKSYFPAILQSPINAGVFCMLVGLIIVPVVSLISKPPKKEYVDDIFACYDKKVVVSVKHAFGDPVQKED
jgi:SSS family solute:Na+ symporter